MCGQSCVISGLWIGRTRLGFTSRPYASLAGIACTSPMSGGLVSPSFQTEDPSWAQLLQTNDFMEFAFMLKPSPQLKQEWFKSRIVWSKTDSKRNPVGFKLFEADQPTPMSYARWIPPPTRSRGPASLQIGLVFKQGLRVNAKPCKVKPTPHWKQEDERKASPQPATDCIMPRPCSPRAQIQRVSMLKTRT